MQALDLNQSIRHTADDVVDQSKILQDLIRKCEDSEDEKVAKQMPYLIFEYIA